MSYGRESSQMSQRRIRLRDLLNRSAEIVERVRAGEHFIIIELGKPVAELVPFRRKVLGREELLARWRDLPKVNAGALREDLSHLFHCTICRVFASAVDSG